MSAVNRKTIYDLEKFDFEHNTNYSIQNLMMQENVGNTKILFDRAEKIYDSTNLNITKQMVRLIIRKHFLCHDVEMHGDSVRIIDKFFGQSERKNVQIMQAKNKMIKR